MPYKGRQAAVLELHLRSLLHVSDYQPRLQREVLRLAVEELVQLDVELPRLSLEPPTAAHTGVEVEGGILPFELDMVDMPCCWEECVGRDLQCPSPRMMCHSLMVMRGPPSPCPGVALCCKWSMLAGQEW